MKYFSYDQITKLIGEPVNVGSLNIGSCYLITQASLSSNKEKTVLLVAIDYTKPDTAKLGYDVATKDKNFNSGTTPCDKYSEGPITNSTSSAAGYKGSVFLAVGVENLSITSAQAVELVKDACTKVR
ncbi:MAG: hypothetical protein KW788_02590 [Candidatus Doudnabacteria bacterium]|nr:hypothetical protein [Candidatus Doudnabacteria bacterium]